MKKVPFSMKAYEGLGSVKGLISLESSELVIEFETSDALLGLLKSGPKEIRLPLADIQSLTLEEGWLSIGLKIQAGSLRSFEGFPKSDHGRVRLSLSKSDREAADELVEKARGLGTALLD